MKTKIVDWSEVDESKIQLEIGGQHNIENAKTAIAVAKLLGISEDQACEALKSFKGTWRRTEYKGEKNGVVFYDDYGHHPTEIKAALNTLREKFPDKKLVVAFQPHLYSRTKAFFNDFAQTLAIAGQVLIAPIYAAREAKDTTVSAQFLADKINQSSANKATAFNDLDFSDLTSYAQSNLSAGDLFLTIGAGDIYKVGETILLNN